MSFEGLQERLTALQDTTTQLKELIERLATIEFTPGALPLATDEEGSVSGELIAEITQALKDGEEEQELLAEEVEYVRGDGHDKTRLRESVEKLGKELASCRLSLRKARLSAKNSLTSAQRLERELLIQSYSRPVSGTVSPDHEIDEVEQAAAPAPVITRAPKHIQKHKYSSLSEEDQQAVGASSDVTNALRRTHNLIAAELARSEFAHQTLTESSAALKQLNESYSSLDTMLASSKDLLGTLLRSQKSDTWYLQTALYMLLVTGAWLVFRRLLYGPFWWLVWLPIRLMFGAGTKVGGAVMQGRSTPGESGKVELGEGSGRVPVEGLPNEDLPIVKVGQEAEIAGEGDVNSIVDRVEKIVDAVNEAEGLGSISEEEEDKEQDVKVENHQRNTKKRMWEETQTPGVVGDARPRDEL